MNRSGWTEEQIEARRKLEAAGLVPERGEHSDDGYSDEYYPEDDCFDNDIFMGGEEGQDPVLDAEDGESAPKRSRSGEKKAIPRRPQPSPPGPAAGDASKPSSDAAPSDPASKNTRAEPAEV
eukprot:15447831-Alexandrium_andersonii.AAC.1